MFSYKLQNLQALTEGGKEKCLEFAEHRSSYSDQHSEHLLAIDFSEGCIFRKTGVVNKQIVRTCGTGRTEEHGPVVMNRTASVEWRATSKELVVCPSCSNNANVPDEKYRNM